MKNKKAVVTCAVLLAILVVLAVVLLYVLKPQGQAGAKTITFAVIDAGGASEEFEIATDAEFLADALVEEGLVEYAQDGMYATINGITADWSVDEGWWNILRGGEALTVGMNDQPIADGEHYEAVYTSGY